MRPDLVLLPHCGKLNCLCVIVSKFDQIHSLSDKLGNNWALWVATDGERGDWSEGFLQGGQRGLINTRSVPGVKRSF